ncbi:LysR family transcriptional regulator [Parvibium lacunae]|uniref:LysR family transcriptional regulator n=1 Tax=Parvibium lacunae TaxID=1888893 RepID=A0A368KZF9_9BURK|nr:LysR family transcriptional regulator [Parvibium lacunae]RCS56532.1 LysR family transcriptional regulator [Parvibium lacunae]
MNWVHDLQFFAVLTQAGSLTKAAVELSLTPAAVSKRLAALEARVGLRLVNRSTRRMSLTAEGELLLSRAQQILSDLDELDGLIGAQQIEPRGLLKVGATFGFGRRYIAPAIERYTQRYPAVQVQLELTDNPIDLSERGFDLVIRLDKLPQSQLIARKIAPNRRFIVAAPSYLTAHGQPQNIAELAQHNCLVLRENAGRYGVWSYLDKAGRLCQFKVRGNLASNDGEVIRSWALAGRGIMLRSEWDVATDIRSGRLRRLLPDVALPAGDVYAVYSERQYLATRIRRFIDFLTEELGDTPPWRQPNAI